MKDTPKPASCHAEHVLVLNALTDGLKEDLKRGLNLMDQCVNQLAQAKWILINVEKTIEDSYASCPACDSSKKKEGATAVSPVAGRPSSTVAVSDSEVPVTIMGKKGKARKASILPMVSGHTIQRPNLSITRVDAKNPKKQKSKGGATTKSVRRSRMQALEPSDLESEDVPAASTSEETVITPKKAGPRSATRAKTGAVVVGRDLNGDPCTVTLIDIKNDLKGKVRLVGSELAAFVKMIELRRPIKKDYHGHENHTSSDEDGSTTSRKKKLLEKQQSTLSQLKEATKPTAVVTTTGPNTSSVAAVLKSSLLKQPQANIKGRLTAAINKVKERQQEEASALETTTRREKKAHSSDSEGSEAEKKSSKRDVSPPARKKSKLDDTDSEPEVLPTSKRTKRKVLNGTQSLSRKVIETDASDDEIKHNTKPMRRKGKNKDDSDGDSDFVPEAKSKSKGQQPGTSTSRKSHKVKSKEIINDSDSSEDDGILATKNSKSSATKKNLSARGDVAVFTDDEKSEKSGESDSESNKKPITTKPQINRPGPASQKARRTNRPGPKSFKAKRENQNTSLKENAWDNGVENSMTDKIFPKIGNPDVSYDSDDQSDKFDGIRIPLDFQDAARSPSPETTDVFGRILSKYNVAPSKTLLQRLKTERSGMKTSKVYELDEEVKEKISKAGRELVPYEGSVKMDDHKFENGSYYIVGQTPNEKLVICEAKALHGIELSDEELEELLKS